MPLAAANHTLLNSPVVRRPDHNHVDLEHRRSADPSPPGQPRLVFTKEPNDPIDLLQKAVLGAHGARVDSALQPVVRSAVRIYHDQTVVSGRQPAPRPGPRS